MGERLPRVTADQALAAVRRAGWAIVRQVGSHAVLHHSPPGRIVIPRHAGRIIKPTTLAGSIRDAGSTVEQFRELM